jgi:hypothetical protein
MNRFLTATLSLSVIAFMGCNDDTFGPGNATEEEREEILAALEESGFFADDVGETGLPVSTSVTSGGAAALLQAPSAALEVPHRWGRRRGFPVARTITVEIDQESGMATVTKQVDFEGLFMVGDVDGHIVEKPLVESAVMSAVVERFHEEDADGVSHRRWRLVGISPAEFLMTAEDQRTVDIQLVEVYVNEQLVVEIADPGVPLTLDQRIPHLQTGDLVSVKASVSNTMLPRDGFESRVTYVYLHMFHASPDQLRWHRVPMELDPVSGMYVRSWEVYHSGRERFAVDAIDEGAFDLDAAGGYRANLWAVPYRVGELVR